MDLMNPPKTIYNTRTHEKKEVSRLKTQDFAAILSFEELVRKMTISEMVENYAYEIETRLFPMAIKKYAKIKQNNDVN